MRLIVRRGAPNERSQSSRETGEEMRLLRKWKRDEDDDDDDDGDDHDDDDGDDDDDEEA